MTADPAELLAARMLMAFTLGSHIILDLCELYAMTALVALVMAGAVVRPGTAIRDI